MFANNGVPSSSPTPDDFQLTDIPSNLNLQSASDINLHSFSKSVIHAIRNNNLVYISQFVTLIAEMVQCCKGDGYDYISPFRGEDNDKKNIDSKIRIWVKSGAEELPRLLQITMIWGNKEILGKLLELRAHFQKLKPPLRIENLDLLIYAITAHRNDIIAADKKLLSCVFTRGVGSRFSSVTEYHNDHKKQTWYDLARNVGLFVYSIQCRASLLLKLFQYPDELENIVTPEIDETEFIACLNLILTYAQKILTATQLKQFIHLNFDHDHWISCLMKLAIIQQQKKITACNNDMPFSNSYPFHFVFQVMALLLQHDNDLITIVQQILEFSDEDNDDSYKSILSQFIILQYFRITPSEDALPVLRKLFSNVEEKQSTNRSDIPLRQEVSMFLKQIIDSLIPESTSQDVRSPSLVLQPQVLLSRLSGEPLKIPLQTSNCLGNKITR